MSQTLENQLRKFEGHVRLTKIVNLMTVFSDKNAERIYDGLISLERYISKKETVADFIGVLTNPTHYSHNNSVLYVEDLKAREKEIASEILGYFTRINGCQKSQEVTLNSQDLIDILKENIKFNTKIIVG